MRFPNSASWLNLLMTHRIKRKKLQQTSFGFKVIFPPPDEVCNSIPGTTRTLTNEKKDIQLLIVSPPQSSFPCPDFSSQPPPATNQLCHPNYSIHA